MIAGTTMIGSELDAAGVHDPRAAGAYRRLPRHQRPARPDLLPGHPAAVARAAARRARAVRIRPAGRRRPRRIRPAHPTAQRADELQRLATPLFTRTWSRTQPSGDDPTTGRGRAHRPQVRHRLAAVRRLPGLHADGPDRHRLSGPRGAGPLHVRLRGGDRPAAAARAGHRRPSRGRRAARGRARKGLPAHQLPARHRRGSGRAAGCTCPPTSSPPTAWTATC